ncbi:MAG: peptide chain release factor N(5)-glutamine methyltransferase [Candidatus Bipolaricaulaceae bacterium]
MRATKTEELLRWGAARLRDLADPGREARRALALACGADGLLPERLGPYEVQRFRRLVEARARGLPWPALEGSTAFLDFEVLVPPGVFVPRPETEELAELALRIWRDLPGSPRALDWGTGTGVLALALARARPTAEVWALDVSARAVAAARRNAQRLGLRLHLLRSHGFARVPGKFQLIVANPPYVPTAQLARLPRDVRAVDPRRALDGGPDGLRWIRALLRESPEFLTPEGFLLMEIGHDQGEAVLRLAHAAGAWKEARVLRDLAGRPRFFWGQRC